MSSSGSDRKGYDDQLKLVILADMLEGKHDLEELAQIHGVPLEVLLRWRDEWVQQLRQDDQVDPQAEADLLKKRKRLESKLKRVTEERDFFAQVWARMEKSNEKP